MGDAVKIEMSQDAKTAHVKINESLSALEIQTLISRLASARSRMKPSVGEMYPTIESPEADAEMLEAERDPAFEGSAAPGSSHMQLKLRSQGMGWLLFHLSFDRAVALRDFLIHLTAGDEEPLSSNPLLDKDVSAGDRSH